MRANRLLSPDPVVSAGAADVVPSGPSTEPKAVPIAAAPAVAPTTPAATPPGAPPAASTVVAGDVTEETLLLRQKLESEQAARKRVEQDHASVSDEFKRYKDATEARQAPAPVPVKQGRVSYRFLKRTS